MSTQPYWAFQPNNPSEARQAAVDEGRRLAALTLAVECGPDVDEGTLATAAKFEAYLKGDAPVTPVETSEYEKLIERSNELLRLEAAGVDNWEGYSRG